MKKRAKPLSASSSTSSGSLFGESVLSPTPASSRAPTIDASAPLDDGDMKEAPRLRIIPRVEPEEDVVIERTGDGRYAVSLVRHHGTTCATVMYTRGQLGMLLRRIPAALEVG